MFYELLSAPGNDFLRGGSDSKEALPGKSGTRWLFQLLFVLGNGGMLRQDGPDLDKLQCAFGQQPFGAAEAAAAKAEDGTVTHKSVVNEHCFHPFIIRY